MRLVQFLTSRGLRIGMERKNLASGCGQVLDLAEIGILEPSVKAFLESGTDRLRTLEDAVKSAPERLWVDAASVNLVAPVHNPGKILCVGLNYRDHCIETNAPIPPAPVFFSKTLNTVCGPDAVVNIPEVAKQVDWEAELAFVIGTSGYNIPVSSAMDHVVGFTAANDVTARDWQFSSEVAGQWLLGKSCDNFCPLGPALVTKDEIADPHNLNVSLRVNGELKQNSNTCQLVFKIPEIVSYVSRLLTLEPGDVILTGTPPGVGCFRNPKEFLKSGDVSEVEIEGIGKLVNTFR